MKDCIFCKVVKKELPSTTVYEDDLTIVIKDVNPVAAVHLLVIPKKHIEEFMYLSDDKLLGELRKVLQRMIDEQKLMEKGYKIRVFGGGAQQVNHLHFHLIGPIGHAVKA